MQNTQYTEQMIIGNKTCTEYLLFVSDCQMIKIGLTQNEWINNITMIL